MSTATLTLGLQTFAALQIAVAILNFFLERIFNWGPDLQRLPQLAREVFRVHSFFISVILLIFGTLTLRFASDMAAGLTPALTWVAGAIALFWGVRTVIQMTVYSSSHWRGHTGRTVTHIALLIIYGGMALVYALASLGAAT